MFEIRPISTRTKFKPVKEPEAEIPPVEFVAELVEVQLEELRFYVMASVRYAMKWVASVALAHHVAQLMHHLFYLEIFIFCLL